MSRAATTCFHCGEPIPAGLRLVVQVAGVAQPVCCHGCAAVAQFIANTGLADYYGYRAANAVRVETVPDADRWSRYDQPAVLERLTQHHADGRRSVHLLLEGIGCAACGWLAQRSLSRLDGVDDVTVDASTARASVTWDPSRRRLSELLRTLEYVGLPPHPIGDASAATLAVQERRQALKRLAVSGFGMMQVMMFAVPLYYGAAGGMDPDMRKYLRLVSLVVAIPVSVYAGWPIYAGARHALGQRTVTMDVPVTVGILLALLASLWNAFRGSGDVYFDSVTMFVFLLTLARYVEMTARHRAGSTADALERQLPGTARRKASGRVEEVPAVALTVGDEIIVPTGEVFAADGTVSSGSGSVDESMLTGESLAVAKTVGETVRAGTRNVGAPLQVRVDAVAADTVLSAIVALLGRAQASKPRIAALADRVAAWFLSRVLLAAAVVFATWYFIDPARALPATLAVLVVTCPCALSLATPAALATAAGALARRGVLVARTDAIEPLAKARIVLWDKTGTLTRGRVELEDVKPLSDIPRVDCLSIAAALEQMSDHPIARAFATVPSPMRVTDCVVSAGAGIAGRIGGRNYRIGSLSFALDGDDALARALTTDVTDRYTVYLAGPEGLIAAFRLTGAIRADAAACVARLASLGVESQILSGDVLATVAETASRLGIGEFAGRMTPASKLDRLHGLQSRGQVVLAVGDGINDAALLRGADVGVAMGRGSAMAQANGDLLLVRDSLEALPDAIEVARRTRHVIRQNLAWSLVYNGTALPLAALGLVPPWLAAVGMSLSSIVVVVNASRLSGARTPVRRDRSPALAPAGVA